MLHLYQQISALYNCFPVTFGKSIPDDLYIDSYTDSIDRYKEIFKEIFIKMDHKAHYDMMMS